MKKSISINISGLLFNIEEDAFEQLKRYLDEIKLYFAGYEASDEIVADIENRIAEIFSTKVGPHKQVLTERDVTALITQMGNIQDFAAAETVFEESRSSGSASHDNYSSSSSSQSSTSETFDAESTGSRRLYRNESQKVIGGVAAGIADYLRIDVLWIRLVMVIILFDFFLTFSFSSALFIGYIVLWIALPAKAGAVKKEDKKSKKMYRNPDDKVVGGVAGGLAAFFGVDPVLIRVLFVAMFIAGGSGLMLYILLWIVMPEARTLTQKMQMQGKPVTLANIEDQVKKNLNLNEDEEESLLARILLFPFRLASTIFSNGHLAVRPILYFMADAVRIIAGFILAFGGFITLMAILISVTVLVGINQETALTFINMEVPFEIIRNTIPDYVMIALLLISSIPVLAVMLLGMRLLANRRIVHRGVSWGLAGVWLIALLIVTAFAPGMIMAYDTNAYHETATVFKADSSKTLVLKLDRGQWKQLQNIELEVEGSADPAIRLQSRIWAHGADNEEAKEHARWASFPVVQKDSLLLFSNKLKLPEDKPYYMQHGSATLYIPHGQPFRMDNSMRRIVNASFSPWAIYSGNMNDNTFAFNQQGVLECLSCSPEQMEALNSNSQHMGQGDELVLNFTDFTKLKVGNNYQLTLIQGTEYKVTVKGDKAALNALEARQEGSTLSFYAENNRNGKWWKGSDEQQPLNLYVTAPAISELSLSGASSGKVILKQGEKIALDLSGASELAGELDVEHIAVDMSGSSQLSLEGSGEALEASLSGASGLKAVDFKTSKTDIELSGASGANIHVVEQLKADLSGGSRLFYQGKPKNTRINKGAGASVSSDNN